MTRPQPRQVANGQTPRYVIVDELSTFPATTYAPRHAKPYDSVALILDRTATALARAGRYTYRPRHRANDVRTTR